MGTSNFKRNNGMNSAMLKMKPRMAVNGRPKHRNIKIKKVSSKTSHPYAHMVRGQLVTKEEFARFSTCLYKDLLYSTKCLRGPSEKFIRSKHVELDVQAPEDGK